MLSALAADRPRRQRRLDEPQAPPRRRRRCARAVRRATRAADAVGHRVVHGGARFLEPTLIDDEVLAAIEELRPLAPLHNEPALRAIRAAQAALPGRSPRRRLRHRLPRHDARGRRHLRDPARWREDWGIRRYGFHGHRGAVGRRSGWTAERLVVCHLGGGCSVTAVLRGRSVDTTMGFTPLEGVPMATRSGSIDPGALLYVLRERGLTRRGARRRARARVRSRRARRARRPAWLRRLHVPHRRRRRRRWRPRSAASTCSPSRAVSARTGRTSGRRSPIASASWASFGSRPCRPGRSS